MTFTILPVIQARTSSTRLPGKVMYPLDGQPTLFHVISRTTYANSVNDVVVVTSENSSDDVIAQCAPQFGANVIRGSESDVLSRFDRALNQYNPKIVVRVTGDCPLVSPQFIDTCVDHIRTGDVDYVCAGLDRTFPRGVTCETFTADSFERVIEASSEPRHREHVTPYYREHPEEFELYNIRSDELFEEKWFKNRTDLRLTLDESADYQLIETVYREIDYSDILDIQDVIQYIDENGLAGINEHVKQKKV